MQGWYSLPECACHFHFSCLCGCVLVFTFFGVKHPEPVLRLCCEENEQISEPGVYLHSKVPQSRPCSCACPARRTRTPPKWRISGSSTWCVTVSVCVSVHVGCVWTASIMLPLSASLPPSASHMLRVFVCAPLVCFRLLLLGKHALFSWLRFCHFVRAACPTWTNTLVHVKRNILNDCSLTAAGRRSQWKKAQR